MSRRSVAFTVGARLALGWSRSGAVQAPAAAGLVEAGGWWCLGCSVAAMVLVTSAARPAGRPSGRPSRRPSRRGKGASRHAARAADDERASSAARAPGTAPGSALERACARVASLYSVYVGAGAALALTCPAAFEFVSADMFAPALGCIMVAMGLRCVGSARGHGESGHARFYFGLTSSTSWQSLGASFRVWAPCGRVWAPCGRQNPTSGPT